MSRDYALTAREHLVADREASVRQREHALQLQEAALRAREASAETRADVERLMGQMREANERLIVAAIDAQNLSDEAHADAVQAKTELDDLMKQLAKRMNGWPPAPRTLTRWPRRPNCARRSIDSCPVGYSRYRTTNGDVSHSTCTTRRRSAWPHWP